MKTTRQRCASGTKLAALFAVFLGANVQAGAEPTSPAFELRDGDRVVFLGAGLFERELRDGYIEAALSLRFADRDITFRNLGWSGDDPSARARAYFGPPKEGYGRLLAELKRLQPTVIVVSYGSNASFRGAEGLASFRQELGRLLDDLAKLTKRMVILSPTPLEQQPPPLPDMRPANANRRLYAKALEELASERGLRFVNLFDRLKSGSADRPLTDNGLHLNAVGYRAAAAVILDGLGLDSGRVDLAKSAQLRRLIVEKNRLYFHRYRPQNETYLRGFRKHEQGRNAVEIPMFDPLIEKQEQQITGLLRPGKAGAK
ncbi:MAG: SGNH/GDSL hydrolase family protein [Phycisphaerae bacterium]|nr:SGNH/GDSL hydrolase family protein [Phycisphaerae bacterium]